MRIYLLSFFVFLVAAAAPAFADTAADPSCLAVARAQLDSKTPDSDRAALACVLAIVSRQQAQIEALEKSTKHTVYFRGCADGDGNMVPCPPSVIAPAQSPAVPHSEPSAP